MQIRRYLIIVILIFFAVIITTLYGYRFILHNKINKTAVYEINDGISKIAKVENKYIQLYTTDGYQDFSIRGIRLSSYYPKYEINKSDINKNKVLNWLEKIKDLNANTILVPYIQPPGFYSAICEYNLTHKEPIYLIHEISLEANTINKTHNAFDEKFYNELKKQIKKTIDSVHGYTLTISDNIHKGVYLKDISKFNLGYIIGNNTFPELVSITNAKNKEIKEYKGKYYSINDATAFEVFITEILDYSRNYETAKYKQHSLLSYLTTIETDPFIHDNESNLTKYANIDLGKIESINNDNLFISFIAQPNDPDFMDFEYMVDNNSDNFYSAYLKKISDHYNNPIVITEIGVSSSRGKSKINLSKGYDRGNYNEIEQGNLLIQLLDLIKQSNITGVFIDSFQDNWGRISSFNLRRYINEDISNYWFDAQASDEAFGLIAFETKDSNNFATVDGNVNEWKNTKEIINDKEIILKVKADTSYLYLMVNKKDWSYQEDDIFIAIDTVKDIGSNYHDDGTKFNVDAEYIIEITGINTSRIIVNSRYNIFDYLYKYNENLLDKQIEIPAADSNIFSSIYLLNRRPFILRKNNSVESAIYYETGKLTHGNVLSSSEDYNSLADFNKEDDYVEIRIPWTIINFTDPLNKKALGDFYLYGTEKEINLNNINFSITLKNNEVQTLTKSGIFKLPNLKREQYNERLKSSYYILQSYWKDGRNLQ